MQNRPNPTAPPNPTATLPLPAQSESPAPNGKDAWNAFPSPRGSVPDQIHPQNAPTADPSVLTLQPSNVLTTPSSSDSVFQLPKIDPSPDPVDGALLLDDLARLVKRFLVLPKWAAETLALFIVHTYAFELRDVTTYLGVESPIRRCGKSTLITVLSRLVNRPIVASNISSPAFFRAIEELRPTLFIDEADTVLQGNNELRGILNSGYHSNNAFVVRVANELPSDPGSFVIRHSSFAHSSPATSRSAASALPPLPSDSRPLTSDLRPLPSSPAHPSSPTPHSALSTLHSSSDRPSRLVRFSCWCPKVIAAIGHLPDTLADRCILVRMQRKTAKEQCERVRDLDGTLQRRQCARFVLDHAQAIASARPELPSALHDRAADIWEPLLAIADLAGAHWPDLARQAAVGLTASADDNSPIASLLFDIFLLFATNQADRILSRDLVAELNTHTDRPWSDLRRGQPITDRWLGRYLSEYDVFSRSIRVGDKVARGYRFDDFRRAFQRYMSKSELEALRADLAATPASAPSPVPEKQPPQDPA